MLYWAKYEIPGKKAKYKETVKDSLLAIRFLEQIYMKIYQTCNVTSFTTFLNIYFGQLNSRNDK